MKSAKGGKAVGKLKSLSKAKGGKFGGGKVKTLYGGRVLGGR